MAESDVDVRMSELGRWLRMQERITQKVRERQATGDLFTVREAARLVRRSIDTVLVLADDAGLTVNVAVGVNGGYGEITRRGDWTMEGAPE